ncbi:protein kinase/lanthionine synthetase C family protein [Stenotrophomonas maltophilia]|nr:protein kinase/lanthionine synthetase C family protein [Stenotrophomonas maltophilia]MBN4961119.1 protein kinase/lanthionine synthetase C family protein [Stenotrophomonas maltophilia]
MDAHPYLTYMISDGRIYETLERRTPDDDLYDLVQSEWPDGWDVVRGSFWTQVLPPTNGAVSYGWKIHVSTMFQDCGAILQKCLPAIVAEGVGFKFLSDRFIVSLSLNKNWPRTQVGKFITIYPQSVEQCRRLAEELAVLTEGYSGPFILTDAPVGKSKSVYVRFGAHVSDSRMNRYGLREPGFFHEDGTWRKDQRRALQHALHSDWKESVPDDGNEVSSNDPVVIGEHFSISKAIKYHGEGGVYHGVDTRTGMQVVVREQRRGLTGMPGREGISTGYTIIKEALLLQQAQSSGSTPCYVAHFEEDEHWFLVQERIVGADTLWGYAMNIYFDSEDLRGDVLLHRLRSIFLRIADGIMAVHRCGVVLRDITKTNVLVTPDGEVKFIDLEFAHAVDENSPWVLGWTRGYGSPQQRDDRPPTVQDDYYAFGALILDVITFSASGLDLDRALIGRKIDRTLSDLDLPIELKAIILGLIEEQAEHRWSIDQAVTALKKLSAGGRGTQILPTAYSDESVQDRRALEISARDALLGLDAFFASSATPDRSDRLWPGPPEQWIINSVGIGYGAAGVALYQLKRGTMRTETLDWIVANSGTEKCPAGLFVGLAGIAYVLCQAGRFEEASLLYAKAWAAREDTGESLYFGRAGLGLVSIQLFLSTGQDHFLQHAIACGEDIRGSAMFGEKGAFWEVEGGTPLGLAEGQAGVALFLLYLDRVAPGQGFLKLGMSAIDYELAHRVEMSGQLLWHRHAAAKSVEPKTPHIWAGTAGIAAVVLRYYLVTSEPEYLEVLDKCLYSLSSRYSNKIWQSEGLSGMIELHLDVAQFMHERADHQMRIAFHLAEAILDHALSPDIDSVKGTAFPGSELLRISSDFSTGSAGIGICIDRLFNGGARVLFLDQLLEQPHQAQCTAAVESVHVE